jgi:hypothetical protein
MVKEVFRRRRYAARIAESGLARISSASAPVSPVPIELNTRAFGAAVVAAQEPTIRYAERRCERREEAFVDGLAGLEPLNRAR